MHNPPDNNATPNLPPRTLRIAISAIDLEALPPRARTPGTPAFRAAVSRLVRRTFARLGGALAPLTWTPTELVLTWQPPKTGLPSIDPLTDLLARGRIHEWSLILELLSSDKPDDVELLYSLGVAYSDLGWLDRAIPKLRRLLAVDPGYVEGRVALEDALMRKQHNAEAEDGLR